MSSDKCLFERGGGSWKKHSAYRVVFINLGPGVLSLERCRVTELTGHGAAAAPEGLQAAGPEEEGLERWGTDICKADGTLAPLLCSETFLGINQGRAWEPRGTARRRCSPALETVLRGVGARGVGQRGLWDSALCVSFLPPHILP